MLYKKYISRSEICELFNYTPGTIQKWALQREFPKPLPCPAREPIYNRDEVESWIEGNFKGGQDD
jgi:predicted DNA-binding transcriptional regulator AlpA